MRQKDGKYKNGLDILSRPDVTLDQMINIIHEVGHKQNNESFKSFIISPLVFDTVEAYGKYVNYLERQEDEMEKWKRNGNLKLPMNMIYDRNVFPNFSSEELEILNKFHPETLHDASQLQGITPETIIRLITFIRKNGNSIKRKNDITSNKTIIDEFV